MSRSDHSRTVSTRGAAGIGRGYASGLLGTLAAFATFVAFGSAVVTSWLPDWLAVTSALLMVAPIGMAIAFAARGSGAIPILIGNVTAAAVLTVLFQSSSGWLIGPYGDVLFGAVAMVMAMFILPPIPGYLVGRLVDWAIADDDGAPPRSALAWRLAAMAIPWALVALIIAAEG